MNPQQELNNLLVTTLHRPGIRNECQNWNIKTYAQSEVYILCHFHEAGTKEPQAIFGFSVQWTFYFLATSQERVFYTPTISRQAHNEHQLTKANK